MLYHAQVRGRQLAFEQLAAKIVRATSAKRESRKAANLCADAKREGVARLNPSGPKKVFPVLEGLTGEIPAGSMTLVSGRKMLTAKQFESLTNHWRSTADHRAPRYGRRLLPLQGPLWARQAF